MSFPGQPRSKKKPFMKRQVVTQLFLSCLAGLCVFSSCIKSAQTHRNDRNISTPAARDSTAYVWKGDSLLPPLKYKPEEMGDFNYTNGAPLRSVISNKAIDYKDTKYLHFLNRQMIEGRKRDKALRKLKDKEIESVDLLSGEQAIELYGQKASNGVIFIVTRKK
jgi:hypothetical protein